MYSHCVAGALDLKVCQIDHSLIQKSRKIRVFWIQSLMHICYSIREQRFPFIPSVKFLSTESYKSTCW